LTDRRVRCLWERLFGFICSGLWGGARGAKSRSQTGNLPGVEGLGGRGIPTVGRVVPSTSRSTMRRTKPATSLWLDNARWPCSKSGLSTWSLSCGNIPASIAERAIRSCSSSTTCGTRGSRSQRACRVVAGRMCSTRLQSARSFVQTVIDAAPRSGAASAARR